MGTISFLLDFLNESENGHSAQRELEVIKEVVAHCQIAKGIRKAQFGMSLLDIIIINSALSRGFIAS